MEQNEVRHGSPTFYSLIKEIEDMHDKKSQDYASTENPVGNYHFAGLVSSMFAHSPEDAGFAGRLAEKIYRLANVTCEGKTPIFESNQDAEVDIAVLACLWMADRRERRVQTAIQKQTNSISVKACQRQVPELDTISPEQQ